MQYRRSGRSGLKLPAVSLGLWHNFDAIDNYEKCRMIIQTAFDSGIAHFDLANNYGPPPGAAEEVERMGAGNPDNVNIQRYKGLGEMNAEQLWETTMNPDTEH